VAVAKLGSLVADIRGKLGDNIYSLARGGIHTVRAMPASVTNPNSTSQQAIRNYFKVSSQRWYSVLTEKQRREWGEMAKILNEDHTRLHNGVMSLVPPIWLKGSGLNAYVSFRSRALMAGFATFSDDAPLGAEQPTPPEITFSEWRTAPPIDGVYAEWSLPSVYLNSNSKFGFWIRSRQRIYHRQLVATGDVTLCCGLLAAARSFGGVSVLFSASTPFEFLGQIQTIDQNGWASSGSNTISVDCG
jgi:hypothetical protein